MKTFHMTWAMLSVLAGALLAPSASAQQCVGDCNSDFEVTIDEVITGVNIGLEFTPLSACPAMDGDSNGSVEINEVIEAVNNGLGLLPCDSPDPRGRVRIKVNNPAGLGSSAGVIFAGRVVDGTARGRDRDQSYEVAMPSSCGTSCEVDVKDAQGQWIDLQAGIWVHRVEVANTPNGNADQIEYRKALVVGDTGDSNPNIVQWTVFPTVYQVNNDTDAGGTTCDSSSCSLRQAIGAADISAQTPVLIQFDHEDPGFTGDIRIGQVSENVCGATKSSIPALSITKPATIDANDADGNPSPFAVFTQRIYPVQIGICPTSGANDSSGRLSVAAAKVKLIGLSLSRILPPPSQCLGGTNDGGSCTTDADCPGGACLLPPVFNNKDEDVVALGTGSSDSGLLTCLVDGGAGEFPSSVAANDTNAKGKDGIDASGFGGTIIENTEIRNVLDRPLKSMNGTAQLLSSWVHNNLRGGPLCMGTGTIDSQDNLIEYNGRNETGQVTLAGRAQLTAEKGNTSARARVMSTRDIVRHGTDLGSGFFFRQYSLGSVTDSFACDMPNYGIEINTDVGTASDPVTIRGTASVLSKRGALLQGGGTPPIVSFGEQGSDLGRNAFVKNFGTNPSVQFRSDVSGTIDAVGNQWQSCGTGNACNESSILSNDIEATAGNVAITPAYPQRVYDPNNPSSTFAVQNVYPENVARVGATVRLTGIGFNAIDGYEGVPGAPSGGATSCETLQAGNFCGATVRGTCVEFGVDIDGQFEFFPAAQGQGIVAVTPTMIAFNTVRRCSVPMQIRVRKLDPDGQVVRTDPPVDFCSESTPGTVESIEY